MKYDRIEYFSKMYFYHYIHLCCTIGTGSYFQDMQHLHQKEGDWHMYACVSASHHHKLNCNCPRLPRLTIHH